MKQDGFTIAEEDLHQEIPLVRSGIHRSGLAEFVRALAPGPYGLTAVHLQVLEVVERALAQALELVKRLGHRLDDPAFVALFALYAAGEAAAARLESLTPDRVEVRSGFPAARVQGLTSAGEEQLAWRLAEDIGEFLARHRDHPDPGRRVVEPHHLAGCAAAYFQLLARGARDLAEDAAHELHRQALEALAVEVQGRRYRGFEVTDTSRREEPGELLPVHLEDIVGNADYLQAGMRLARDVAGYDFARGENPKRLNPVLFALGAPGCGKTVTAHAVGNYFLDYCGERDIPARFLVIRRTDWASSYQNASAQRLVDIFRDEVRGFPGVVGVYWPDIDTAFAARTDPGLRSEERNILGASFGVFDGTLIPKDGKWFLLCDANFMNMDEATLSRITQDPYRLRGPVTPEHFVELMRDRLLREVADLVPLSDEQWLQVGERCVAFAFSGRNVDSICRKVVIEIQDVEPPDEYYRADFEQKRRILRDLSHPITAGRLQEILEAYNRFEKEAEAAAQERRFRERVQEIVFNLSAQQAAMEMYGRD